MIMGMAGKWRKTENPAFRTDSVHPKRSLYPGTKGLPTIRSFAPKTSVISFCKKTARGLPALFGVRYGCRFCSFVFVRLLSGCPGPCPPTGPRTVEKGGLRQCD